MEKKHVILIILIITSGIFYYLLTEQSQSQETSVRVTRVIDGDTFEIENSEKVRMKGINTPEKNMPGYEEAKTFLRNIIENQSIEIVSYGADKYNRILAYAFLNGQNINEEILKQGLATLYYYEEDEFYNDMKKAEGEARKNELGIWEKSQDENCLKIIQLKYEEPNERCTNGEIMEIKNNCDKTISITLKDDATHIYDIIFKPQETYKENFSCIWNDDGDSLYAWDRDGKLILFYRY